MRKVRVLAVLLVALVVLAGCGGGSSLGKTKTYELGDLLTIEYPEAWHVYDESGMGVLLSPEEGDLEDQTPRPMFVMMAAPMGEEVELSEESMQELVQSMDVNEVGAIEGLKVGGKPAFRQSFEGGEDEFIAEQQGWILAAGEPSPVAVIAVAPTGDWKEYEGIFEAMLSTLKFK